MKTKTTQRKIAEVAVGAVIGGAIAGPIGAVAGGLTAGDIGAGYLPSEKSKGRGRRSQPGDEDPIVHAHPKRILVPVDFSSPSLRALRFAREWAARFGAKIILLHVVEPTFAVVDFGSVPIGKVERDFVGRAKAALKELVRSEFPKSARVSVEVRKGAAFDAIVEAARELKVDMIIIATHGHSGFKLAVLGSTAERVVRHASCPVLTLRRAPGRR